MTDIPKTFHWIWFGDQPMPEQHRRWIDGWLKLHLGWKHKLWTDANRPQFVNEAQFLFAGSLAQKADIARYEIVHRHGGVYLDTDMECLRSIEPLIEGMHAFIAAQSPDSLEDVGIGIIGATPRHPWLAEMIARLPRSMKTAAGIRQQTGPLFARSVTVGRPDVTIFPEKLFRHEARTPLKETVAVHHGSHSWHDPEHAKYRATLRRLATEDIEPVIPPGALFILLDKGRGLELSDGRRAVPFPELNGEWAGYPVDDAAAIAELDRLRRAGAQFMVVPAWMNYWLDSYPGLKNAARCVVNNERAMIFDLRARMAIPRVFHWVWLGDKPLPEQYRRWIDSWLAMHPTWEHRIWTDANRPTFVNETEFLAADNFAMKSDIARYEIVSRFGGVYLDADMECLRSIEPLLTCVDAFIASEEPGKTEPLATVIIGATPNHPWLREAVARLPQAVATGFGNLHQTGPMFITSVTVGRADVTIFPEEFFRHEGRPVTGETYAIHHGAGSWRNAGLAKYESKLREFVCEDIEPVIPAGGVFVLVNKGRGLELSGGRRSLTFPEREGEWAGYPANDAAAIDELKRLERDGAKFVVFPSPMFYWLDAYPGLRDYLNAEASCVRSNERVRIFELGRNRTRPHNS